MLCCASQPNPGTGAARRRNLIYSPLPSDQCIDGGNDCLSLAALVPRQISALNEPLNRVVIEHAANKALTTVHGSARFPRFKSLRPIALSTARSNTETVSRRTSCRTPLISCFAK